MYDVRLFFEKKGRAKYISHLDLYRCFGRAIKRSGVPVWYTQGFNQHMYLTFALPLSLGTEGTREVVDIRFTQEMDFQSARDRINKVLPDDIQILEIALPIKKPAFITTAAYKVILSGSSGTHLKSQMDLFLQKDEIIIEKKSKKKGGVQLDIRPYFETMENESIDESSLTFEMILPAGGSLNINPQLLMDTFMGFLQESDVDYQIVRTNIYDEDGNQFA